LSKDKIMEKREEKERKELEGSGNPVKFSRDLESNLTVKDDVPVYGMKEHPGFPKHHNDVLIQLFNILRFIYDNHRI